MEKYEYIYLSIFMLLLSLMRFYSRGALLKVMFGLAILWVIYYHVQVYQQPVIGLSLGFLGTFLSVWGGSYFFFLLCYKVFSSRPEMRQNSESYTHSLLLAVRTMVQIALVITGNWSYFIAALTVAVFVVLHLTIIQDASNKSTA